MQIVLDTTQQVQPSLWRSPPEVTGQLLRTNNTTYVALASPRKPAWNQPITLLAYTDSMHDNRGVCMGQLQGWALRQMPRYRLRQQWFSKTLMLPQSRHLFVIIAPFQDSWSHDCGYLVDHISRYTRQTHLKGSLQVQGGRRTRRQSHIADRVAGAVWDQVSGLTPKGIKRMIISIVDADGERIITSHTAHSTSCVSLALIASVGMLQAMPPYLPGELAAQDPWRFLQCSASQWVADQ